MTHNKELADRQRLSEEERICIDVLHEELYAFLQRPTFYTKPENCPEIVTAFEYALQSVWGFPLDKKYHRYQFDLNKCLCGTLDNLERVGYTETRIYNDACPYHGGKDEIF